jgi:hypothetical protein
VGFFGQAHFSGLAWIDLEAGSAYWVLGHVYRQCKLREVTTGPLAERKIEQEAKHPRPLVLGTARWLVAVQRQYPGAAIEFARRMMQSSQRLQYSSRREVEEKSSSWWMLAPEHCSLFAVVDYSSSLAMLV